jgi:apolipoprotein D and lipocalin family protein
MRNLQHSQYRECYIIIMKKFIFITISLAAILVTSCQTAIPMNTKKLPAQQAITKSIKLNKFMGDWYVIAHIPTFIEKEAYNAVEKYELQKDGSINTTFFFNKGDFDGPLKTYKPRGFVYNKKTNTEWRMQFLWPFKSAYLVTHLDDKYQNTIIGVPNRRHVWIMARTKTIPEKTYNELVAILKNSGHHISKLRKVPQR